MALAAVKTFIPNEVLYAADLNALNTNILNNPISLISPFTASVDAGGFNVTALDELALTNAAANATAAGRLRRNATNLTWHNGTSAAPVLQGAFGVLSVQVFS
jgi:hypothetical protein